MRLWYVFLGLFLLCFYGKSALGQELQGLGMSIEAQDLFEWRRKENLYIAEGNVILKRGEAVFRADRVLVFYEERDPANRLSANLEVRRVMLEGGVVITVQEGRMEASHVTYEVQQHYLVAKGEENQPVHVDFSGRAMITSQILKYWLLENRLVADGSVDIMLDDVAFRSDFVQLFLQESPNGVIVAPDSWFGREQNRLQIDRAEAEGDIFVEAVGAKISGDKGVFEAGDMEVELCGSVLGNWQSMEFSGDCAVVDIHRQNVRFYNLADGDEFVKMSVPLSVFGE